MCVSGVPTRRGWVPLFYAYACGLVIGGSLLGVSDFPRSIIIHHVHSWGVFARCERVLTVLESLCGRCVWGVTPRLGRFPPLGLCIWERVAERACSAASGVAPRGLSIPGPCGGGGGVGAHGVPVGPLYGAFRTVTCGSGFGARGCARGGVCARRAPVIRARAFRCMARVAGSGLVVCTWGLCVGARAWGRRGGQPSRASRCSP